MPGRVAAAASAKLEQTCQSPFALEDGSNNTHLGHIHLASPFRYYQLCDLIGLFHNVGLLNLALDFVEVTFPCPDFSLIFPTLIIMGDPLRNNCASMLTDAELSQVSTGFGQPGMFRRSSWGVIARWVATKPSGSAM